MLIESRTRAPLIRLGIFKVRSLAGANLVLLVVIGGLFGFFFFSTLYVQQVLGYSPLEAGLAFLPVTIGIGAGAGIAQQLVKRLGVRATAVLGMLIAAFGLWLFSHVSSDGTYLSDVLPAIIPQSIGMGLFFVPITLIATTNVGEEDAGLGVRAVQHRPAGRRRARAWRCCRRSRPRRRRACWPTWATARRRAEQTEALLDGFQVAFTLGAILVASGAVLLVLLVRREDVANVNPDAAPVPGA